MTLESYSAEFIEQLFNSCLNFEKTYLIYNSETNSIYTYLLRRDSTAIDFKNFAINHKVHVLSDYHLVPSNCHLNNDALLSVDKISLAFYEAISFSEIFKGILI